MKTAKNLFPQVWDFENLFRAAMRAHRGKRRIAEVYRFDSHLERNLFQLQDELRLETWTPGPYHDFEVREPKRRLVSAAPYRDRVVHHALCQVLEPVFEPRFIFDSYGCRVGKGAHAAADRYTEFSRQADYVLKCDVRRYFESVRHEVLLDEIARYVRDPALLRLIDRILASNDSRAGTPPGCGIPIGNLTSQFFANVYLSRFDHWVKEELRASRYIRYMDDFVLLDDDKRTLHAWCSACEERLATLGLDLHPKKRSVFPVSQGCDFMGFRIWQTHRRLRPSTGYAGRRKLMARADAFRRGRISRDRLRSSLMSWVGHLTHGETWGLRRAVLREFDRRCGPSLYAPTAFGAAAASTTTTITAGRRAATTTTRTIATTTSGSALPASPPQSGLASHDRRARRTWRG